MTLEIVSGLTCGLGSAAVSEAILRLGPPVLEQSLFRALAAGAALRTLWILALLAWALGTGAVEPRLFVPALLLGYLAAQVFEGVRYTRYFEKC